MITVDYKFLIIIMTSCVPSNAHSLLTENNETKTKDINILRQLLNQETLFRIALTKVVENIKQYLLSKQETATNQENDISEDRHVSEERNLVNSSFLRTLTENVNGQKLEDLSNEISSQREQFSQLSNDFKKLSAILLKGFDGLENTSTNIYPVQKSYAKDFGERNDLLGKRYRDCQEMLRQNEDLGNQNGVYTIYLGWRVFCDMTTNGGEWTVIQRRLDGSTDFNREWKDFKEGFGDPNKEYWLGNDALHDLTDRREQELWIDLGQFSGSFVYARYSSFSVGNEKDKYQLTIAGYNENAVPVTSVCTNITTKISSTRSTYIPENVLNTL